MADNLDPFAPAVDSGLPRWCARCGQSQIAEAGKSGYKVPHGWSLRVGRPAGEPERLVCYTCARGLDGDSTLTFEAEHEVWRDVGGFADPTPRFRFVQKKSVSKSYAELSVRMSPIELPFTGATEALRDLDRVATAGPWHRCSANDGMCQCGLVWAPDGNTCLFNVEDAESDPVPVATRQQNMDVAIASRNALPALLDIADAARALFGTSVTTQAQWSSLRLALQALDAQDISTFATPPQKKEEDMALVQQPAPSVTANGPLGIQTDQHGRVIPTPGRLSAHLSPIGAAVMSGAKLVLVNETGEAMLDIVRKLAKGNALIEAALDDPNGRALILFVAATFVHGVAVEAPGVVPKSQFVARAAQKQIEASTFLLGHQNASFVRGLGAELMEMFKTIGDAEELHERLTEGAATPKLDAEKVEQPEPAAAR